MDEQFSNGEQTQRVPVSVVKQNNLAQWLLIILLVIVVVGGLVIFRKDLFPGSKPVPITNATLSGFQMVLLSSGQTYFGHLSNVNGMYPELTDVFYITTSQATATTQAQAQLEKFTNNVEAPTDELFLNQKEILYYENLSEASQVVKAIEAYKPQ